MSVPTRVWAVCVTFDPEILVFSNLVNATRPQVDGFIVVDNGSRKELHRKIADECRRMAIELVSLPSNKGLASALNVGISLALSNRATDILLLDHDSVPDPGMVAGLVAAKHLLFAKGNTVGALGAKAFDARTGRVAPFVQFGIMGLRRRICRNLENAVVPTDVLNTSGTLISASALAAVGKMDEALYIDHVDTDWCLRASAAGFMLFGVCGAALRHRLGDRVVSIPFPVNRSVHVHTPSRFYFFVRNSIVLYRRPYAPLKWIVPDMVRLFRLILFCCLALGERRNYLHAAWCGLRDGYCGRYTHT